MWETGDIDDFDNFLDSPPMKTNPTTNQDFRRVSSKIDSKRPDESKRSLLDVTNSMTQGLEDFFHGPKDKGSSAPIVVEDDQREKSKSIFDVSTPPDDNNEPNSTLVAEEEEEFAFLSPIAPKSSSTVRIRNEIESRKNKNPAESLILSSSGNHQERRRFPGPAGVTNPSPPIMKNNKYGKNLARQLKDISRNKDNVNLSSSGTDSTTEVEKDHTFFSSRAWREMLMVRKQDEKDPNSEINKFNINWINSELPIPEMKSRQCPVLHLVLKSIDLSSNDPSCVFMDRTGTLKGMFHREVIDAHPSITQVGSVLVLRKVPVIVTNFNRYIIITLAKLVSVFWNKKDCADQKDITTFTKEDIKKMSDKTVSYENRLMAIVRRRKRFGINGTQDQVVTMSTPQNCDTSIPPKNNLLFGSGEILCSPVEFPGQISSHSSFRFKSVDAANKFFPPPSTTTSSNLNAAPSSASNELEGLDEESLFGDF